MKYLPLLLALVLSASALRPSKDVCKKYSPRIAAVKRDVQHPILFCQNLLQYTRTRSPLPGFSPDGLVDTCTCLLFKAGKRVTPGNSPAPVKAKPAGGYKCNDRYVWKVKKEFDHPVEFCKFFNAIPRTQSFIQRVGHVAIAQACKCIPSPKPTSVRTTTSKTTTSKTTTSKVSSSTVTSTSTSTADSTTSTTTTASTTSTTSTTSALTTTSTSTSTTTTTIDSPATVTAAAPPNERFVRYHQSHDSVPEDTPSYTPMIVTSLSAAVQKCADLAESSALQSFVVLQVPTQDSSQISWFCGGWPTSNTDPATWAVHPGTGVYALAYAFTGNRLDASQSSSTTSSATLTLTTSTSTTSSLTDSTSTTSSSTTSTSTTTTSMTLTTSTSTTSTATSTTSTAFSCPQPLASLRATTLNSAAGVTTSTSWTVVFAGSSTAVTTVGTLTTEKYSSTSAYTAVMTACANLALYAQNINLADAQFNLQYLPANPNSWNCVVYNNLFYAASVNYADEDSTIACSYGYEMI